MRLHASPRLRVQVLEQAADTACVHCINAPDYACKHCTQPRTTFANIARNPLTTHATIAANACTCMPMSASVVHLQRLQSFAAARIFHLSPLTCSAPFATLCTALVILRSLGQSLARLRGGSNISKCCVPLHTLHSLLRGTGSWVFNLNRACTR